MSFVDMLDPEIAAVMEAFPAEMITAIGDAPPKARAMFDELMAQFAAMLPETDVNAEESSIPGLTVTFR